MNPLLYQTHCQRDKLTLKNPEYLRDVRHFTFDELKRDLFPKGDITSSFLFHKKELQKKYIGRVFAKESGIVAGMQEAEYFLARQSLFKVKVFKKDGATVRASSKKTKTILEVCGTLGDLLNIERTLLNLIGRMSGVATHTAHYIAKAKRVNSNILITPTRKTLWGLLDKRACVVGGGGTHRLNLSDAILIKNNHLSFFIDRLVSRGPAGTRSVGALARARSAAARFFEIEVRTFQEALWAAKVLQKLKQQFSSLPTFIMFDNISPKIIRRSIKKLKAMGYAHVFEASGGINQKNITAYAKTGVHIISIGALTHSAPFFDVSFEISSP